MLVVRRSGRATASVRTPAIVTVPTTVLYNARSGPAGTTLLTEPVDPLTLAVPAGWQTPALDPLTLPSDLVRFAVQAPSLAALLGGELPFIQKAAVRLFAYQAGPPGAFVSVLSYSSPGATVPSQSGLAAVSGKKVPNVTVTVVTLPAGPALKVDSSLESRNRHVAVEILTLVSGGRAIEIEMVSEGTVGQTPPLFAQIAQSLRLS